MPRHFLHAILAAALAFGAQAAFAQPKPPPGKTPAVQEKKAATTDRPLGMENAHAMCIGCHGIPGYKTAYPLVYHVPKIAGQQPGYIVAALKAYKSGERDFATMRAIAAPLSEQDMQALANYYASAGAPAQTAEKK
jgi:cytochrome c553